MCTGLYNTLRECYLLVYVVATLCMPFLFVMYIFTYIRTYVLYVELRIITPCYHVRRAPYYHVMLPCTYVVFCAEMPSNTSQSSGMCIRIHVCV